MTQSSLQPSSIPTYQRAWKLFDQFHFHVFQTFPYKLPISPPLLALFIAYMFDRRYAPSTVNTYVSALGYSHKLMGLTDPTKIFYIVQMLKGYGKQGFRLDARLPIILSILNRLLMAVPHCVATQYDQCLFRAMCALAFFAFLRIGEITETPQPGNCPIQLNQLTKLSRDGEVIGYKLTFADYKHNYNQRPFTMVINRQPGACPVQLLSNYLNHRGRGPGPVFMTAAGVAVPRKVFTANLVACLKYCDLSPVTLQITFV